MLQKYKIIIDFISQQLLVPICFYSSLDFLDLLWDRLNILLYDRLNMLLYDRLNMLLYDRLNILLLVVF